MLAELTFPSTLKDFKELSEFLPWVLSGTVKFALPVFVLLFIVLNHSILPPHLRLQVKWEPLDSVYRAVVRWLPRRRNSQLTWWQTWPGKQWLALTVFGRHPLMPWRRNRRVVLVWDELQTLAASDQAFLQFLHRQAQRHDCRLLVILNLYDRGLIPLCAKPIAAVDGHLQPYFLVDWLQQQREPAETSDQNQALAEIAECCYGNPKLTQQNLRQVVCQSDFNWQDAPLMALVMSSPRLPVRFAVTTRNPDAHYPQAMVQVSPLSLIRPCFLEFWRWLAEATGDNNLVLPWDDGFMDDNNPFWPFASRAGAFARQRWNWVSQQSVKFGNSNTVWQVLAVKSGYQQRAAAALKRLVPGDCVNYFSYAPLWGEAYYLELALLYVQAAERQNDVLEQQELYALAALALECALNKMTEALNTCAEGMVPFAPRRQAIFAELLASHYPEPERIVGLIMQAYLAKPEWVGGLEGDLQQTIEAIKAAFARLAVPLDWVEPTQYALTEDASPLLNAVTDNTRRYMLLLKLAPLAERRTLFGYLRSRYWHWLEQASQQHTDSAGLFAQAEVGLVGEDSGIHLLDPRIRQFLELWLQVTEARQLQMLALWVRIAPDLIGAGLVGAAHWALIQASDAAKWRMQHCLAKLFMNWREQWHGRTAACGTDSGNPDWPAWLSLLLARQAEFLAHLQDAPLILPQLPSLPPLLEGMGYALGKTYEEAQLQQVIAALD